MKWFDRTSLKSTDQSIWLADINEYFSYVVKWNRSDRDINNFLSNFIRQDTPLPNVIPPDQSLCVLD